jgi:hypothetical protein
MEYPEEVIAEGAKGKKEARVLRQLGSDYAVYGYADDETGKMESKYSILLRKGDGALEHLFIVPTSGGKELVVKHSAEKAERRAIWDSGKREIVYF